MPRLLPTIALFTGLLVVASISGNTTEIRSLKFHHTHTGKTLEAAYWIDGAYNPLALEDLNEFLADWRDLQETQIDPHLLDILWQIQQETGNDGVFEVISAYRSSETNEMLRETTTGVAQKSQHVLGKAIDVRLRGLDTAKLRDTARELHLGGVGYYASSDFVHIDTGRPRYW